MQAKPSGFKNHISPLTYMMCVAICRKKVLVLWVLIFVLCRFTLIWIYLCTDFLRCVMWKCTLRCCSIGNMTCMVLSPH